MIIRSLTWMLGYRDSTRLVKPYMGYLGPRPEAKRAGHKRLH